MTFRSLLVTLLIVLLAGGAAAGATDATSPPALAKRLTSDVVKARTNAARYQALLAAMKALHVPVFTVSGKQLSPGAKGLPQGFNLYDFQLRAAAGSFARTAGIDDLARVLSSGRKRVSAATARSILLRGVRAAVARSSSSASTVGLLVRELGLRHRPAIDLGRDVPAAKLTLDPLQALLILADSTVRSGRTVHRQAAAFGATPCEETIPLGLRYLGVAGVPIGPALPVWKLV